MSWGERSCVRYGDCPHNPTFTTCDVNCPHYRWNNYTIPDSTKNTKMGYTKQEIRKHFSKNKYR